MNQEERRAWLIHALSTQQPELGIVTIPSDAAGQKHLLRALFNVRPAMQDTAEFLRIQDEYLAEEKRIRGIVDAAQLPATAADPRIILWRGDITRLKVDAIVNAANSGMTGCYQPNHACIDNCIHTYAGVQLRSACQALMDAQGHEEPTGTAKLTPGFNLPARYVLHTVGPIVRGALSEAHRRQLADCYRACMALSDAHGLESVAFCCISTGVFGFPQQAAAQIAVQTAKSALDAASSVKRVVFNVYQAADETLYRQLLGADEASPVGCDGRFVWKDGARDA